MIPQVIYCYLILRINELKIIEKDSRTMGKNLIQIITASLPNKMKDKV